MKSIKALIALSLTALALTACASIKSKTYTREMTVVATNAIVDIVVLTDTEGNQWEFHGVENWIVGDNCTCLMNNKGTARIKDDAIIFTTTRMASQEK